MQGEQDDRVADHFPALGQEPDDKLGIPCELKPVAGRRQRTGEPSLGARRPLTAPYRRPANCRRPCRLLSVSPHDHAVGLRSPCAISSPALRTTPGVTPVTLGRTGGQTTTARVPIRYPNSRDFPVKAGEWPSALTVAKSGYLQAFSLQNPALHALLAMQKVEGSNPFSRS